MSRKSTSKASQTDWKRLYKMRDEDIDLSEIPEITAEQIAGAALRVGGKPAPKGKVRVNLALDANIEKELKRQDRKK